MRYHRVLTIAGSDSGGGAGIQADIKTASACGCFSTSAITAITVQNTIGVSGIHVIPHETVEAQAEAVLSDIGADAVKLGMLPTVDCVNRVASVLRKHSIKNVVLDPVMIATSGDRLVSAEAVEAIKRELFPIAKVVTPNIPEAEFITGIKIVSEESYRAVAECFFALGAEGVLIKSGHSKSADAVDILFAGGREYRFPYTKTNTKNTHGTGCTLSSAIASFLARGYSLADAVGKAEDYVHAAVAAGADYETGCGHGPVNHFFEFWK